MGGTTSLSGTILGGTTTSPNSTPAAVSTSTRSPRTRSRTPGSKKYIFPARLKRTPTMRTSATAALSLMKGNPLSRRPPPAGGQVQKQHVHQRPDADVFRQAPVEREDVFQGRHHLVGPHGPRVRLQVLDAVEMDEPRPGIVQNVGAVLAQEHVPQPRLQNLQQLRQLIAALVPGFGLLRHRGRRRAQQTAQERQRLVPPLQELHGRK